MNSGVLLDRRGNGLQSQTAASAWITATPTPTPGDPSPVRIWGLERGSKLLRGPLQSDGWGMGFGVRPTSGPVPSQV